MARQTERRDRGVRGIPGTVADRGAGVVRVGAVLSAGGAGGICGTRTEVERGAVARVLKGANELSWTALKTRMIY
jgi:phosphosulfolactate synthase (CoM biosynthesis protein A)